MAHRLRQVTFLFLQVLMLTLQLQSAAGSDDDDIFQYIRTAVPDEFTLGQHYPSRNETEECRPIRLRIVRDSHQYRTTLVVNSNPDITFSSSDAQVMTSRLQIRLNHLALSYYEEYSEKITVLRAWVEYSDNDGLDDPYSLHYEGRTVSVQVNPQHFSDLLKLAVEAGFDWVVYESTDYVRLSVIPDVCNANLDMVFMLDQSGSVGVNNHDIALQFLQDVVSFFNISSNATQAGLITFSSGAAIEFQLNEHTDIVSLQNAFQEIEYAGGWTTTALALLLARLMLDPSRGYGARPTSAGVPKIAILLTDGRSNIYSIRNVAPLLRNSGVQVYTVGVGNVYLDELRFIASDPDRDHVFLLSSFNDAPDFVDFLSFTACDAPAIVVPGENTTTEVEEDGFRFFQSECPAFSQTIMIEQIDLVGTCSLYASTVVQNPGPLSPHGVISNEDHSSRKRSVRLQLSPLHRFIYWAVKGVDSNNLFSVIIWDRIFQEDTFTVSVPEGIEGAFVFNLNDALRMTNVTFNYSINSGDDSNLFAIHPATGIIVTAAPLDVNIHTQFSLMIVAQNSEFSCHRGRVLVEVLVTRDRIEFPPLSPVFVFENATSGDEVTQVQVLGGDSTVEYSITGGNVGNAFSIGTTSGVIEVSAPLNFETVDSYSLTIQAMQASTGTSDTAVQVVDVDDVNEPPFFVTQCAVTNSCEFSVSDVAAANIPVATIVAGDPDRETSPNGVLTFSITEGVPFIVIQTGRSAEIQTGSFLPGDTLMYVFTLVVSDIETSVTTTITVRLNDTNNNAPVFVQAPKTISVQESTSPGEVLTQYIATDADEGTNAEIIYSISSDLPSIPFSVDPNNGTLYLSGPLDFEERMSYLITITASNPDGLQSTNATTAILVMDVNDNPPVFSQAEYLASVEENSGEGTVVTSVRATDDDSGQIDFSIVPNDIFVIDQVSPGIGIISVAPGADIDREAVQSYELTVIARDRGSPQLSNTARVIITVIDVNDNPPIFFPGGVYDKTVDEDVPLPFNVITVSVFDRDDPSTPNAQVDFQITSGNVGDVFTLNQIDNGTAIIQLIRQLSFETQPSYILVITATDRGTNPGPLSAMATVNIRVTNVITSAPVVNGNQTIEVSIGTDVGTPIAVINATDADGDRISFNILSVMSEGVSGQAALEIFDIDDNGVVSLARALNIGNRTRFEIKIAVTDGILTTNTLLIVVAVNENQFPPNITSQAFSVLEEEFVGAVVGTVVATDMDANPSESLTFSIVSRGRVFDLFSIETDTGILRTTQILDREALARSGIFTPGTDSTETITVEVLDGGSPQMSSTAEINITLVDINDNAPVFLVPNDTVGEVFENRLANVNILGSLQLAQDADLGQNGLISYSLEVLDLPAGVASPFVISDDGEITVTMPLDREARESYSVLVRARDRGEPPLTTILAITVIVLDENDHTPNFTQNVYTIDVLETATPPEVLLQVFALDGDAGIQSEVTYSIVSVEPPSTSPLFSLNNVTGDFVLVGNLDFESNPSHTITIRAEDGGSPRRSAIATIEVTVENVDEIPPVFRTPCVVRVSENIPTGISITSCIAIDEDDTLPNPTVATQYELVEGNVGGAFAISNDGSVRVVAPLDREMIDFYSIRVRGTDRVGLSADTFLNITVSDVNDNPPIIANLPMDVPIPVAKIRSQSTEVIAVNAADADIGINADLVYSIDSISQLPGDQTTNISVLVADRGVPVMMVSSFLTLLFEEPCTLQQYSINSANGSIDGQFLCSVEASPEIADVTVGTNAILFCPIVQNIPVEYRWLHNGTVILGPVSLVGNAGELEISSATFQDAGEYICRASSAIGTLQSLPALVRVQVPPTITLPPVDRSVETGRVVSFRCVAIGVPTPTITWSRLNPDGSTTPVVASSRILLMGPFLTIDNVQNSDAGTYVCTAGNRAGEVTATADLILFGRSSVVIVPVMAYSMPNMEQSCHQFNSTQFENAMNGITSVSTMVTGLDGENVCNQTACSPSPCMNGGSCNVTEGDPSGLGYSCSCPLGYTGTNCETDVNECNNSPCLSGGTCTNSDGSFTCDCPPDTTGHRCQYSTVCDTQPCPTNQLCIATVANDRGHVCEEQTSDGLTVALGQAGAGMLDDQVNNLVEVQQERAPASSTRRKRQADDSDVDLGDYVTTCEARFLPVDEGQYLLRWACPEGVEPPTGNDLDEICNMLFSSGLVTSCQTPSGLSRTTNPPLPPTTVLISFILVSNDGSPLTGREAISLLTRTAALEKLQALGYQATNFTAAVPFENLPLTASQGIVVGVVVAVIVAVFTAGLIFCLVVCFMRQRNSKKQNTVLNNSQTLDTIYPLSPDSHQGNTYMHSSYVSVNQSAPLEHTFTFTNSSPSLEPSSSRANPFDNEIYGQRYIPPHITTRSFTSSGSSEEGEGGPQVNGESDRPKRRGSSLKRSSIILRGKRSSLGRRTESRDNLLGDKEDGSDYDRLENCQRTSKERSADTPPPLPEKRSLREARPPTANTQYKDEEIYGNIQHRHAGAHGNAGERWESYWQTQTLFRSAQPPAEQNGLH